jgi:non-homologous end joining protein Ku
MVAIGRLVMSTRERIGGIEIEEHGLRLTTLRTAEEVRAMAMMHAAAAELIDRYKDALREIRVLALQS